MEEKEEEEAEEEEESNGTGKDEGGGRRRCKSSWGEEAELTHKGGRCFISRERSSQESSSSSSSSASIREPAEPCSIRPLELGFLRLFSVLTHRKQAAGCFSTSRHGSHTQVQTKERAL
ncbi:hypothetical protein Q5P01_014093 [Channa striata]|uniref:Uncharacterized protein n=1 Tax=Channa striata TaxID=64152 RepID=A0AA88MKH3_CHASR|nr:hypothetical protein Q5P01_014093 [Channa striata]